MKQNTKLKYLSLILKLNLILELNILQLILHESLQQFLKYIIRFLFGLVSVFDLDLI